MQSKVKTVDEHPNKYCKLWPNIQREELESPLSN